MTMKRNDYPDVSVMLLDPGASRDFVALACSVLEVTELWLDYPAETVRAVLFPMDFSSVADLATQSRLPCASIDRGLTRWSRLGWELE